MQFAIRNAPQAFDYKSFAAASAALAADRPVARFVFPVADAIGVPGSASADLPPSQARWLVGLHLAAARRWLARSPARPEEIERSLLAVADAGRAIDERRARELLDNARELARGAEVAALLERLAETFGGAA